MSKEDKDIFDKLFQDEFRSHTEMVEGENWDLISARLSRKRFFKFNPKRFNIYYASALLISGLLIVGFFFFTTDNKPKTDTNLENVRQPLKDLKVSDRVPSQETFAVRKKAADKLVSTKNLQENSRRKEVQNITIDSVSNIPIVSPVEKTNPPVKETPKTKEYFVYEQDTIVEQDTINVKRRKRKK